MQWPPRRHLIAALQQEGFDPSVMRSLREGQREGHAYSFVHRFYLPDGVPIVPVFLNAYYEPNQPRPAAASLSAKPCVTRSPLSLTMCAWA